MRKTLKETTSCQWTHTQILWKCLAAHFRRFCLTARFYFCLTSICDLHYTYFEMPFSLSQWPYLQCVQIGWLMQVFGNKLFHKTSPNALVTFWAIFKIIISLLCKKCVTTFGQFWGKQDNFLFHHLVTQVKSNSFSRNNIGTIRSTSLINQTKLVESGRNILNSIQMEISNHSEKTSIPR